MGIEYYAMCPTTKRFYALHKGGWDEIGKYRVNGATWGFTNDPEVMERIRKLVAHYDIKDHERYAQHIFTGLQAVGPYFAVINDCQHETIDMLEGYKCVGDRFLEEEQ